MLFPLFYLYTNSLQQFLIIHLFCASVKYRADEENILYQTWQPQQDYKTAAAVCQGIDTFISQMFEYSFKAKEAYQNFGI